MTSTMTPVKRPKWWHVELDSMPHFEEAMQRVYAWYEGQVLDRPPVRFMSTLYTPSLSDKPHPADNPKDIWFDVEFRVESYLQSIEGHIFHGETFPFFYPFLGVDSYAAFYGAELTYDNFTSWSAPVLQDWEDLSQLKLDMTGNETFAKIEELTRYALERCQGKSLVGYTSLHPGIDCAAAWRGFEQLCLDMVYEPGKVKEVIEIALIDFQHIFDHFNALLSAKNNPSLSWMAVPSFETMHIPGCDFATLVSPNFFEEFILPALQIEVRVAEKNIFHVDGAGGARHHDAIFDLADVSALPWAQGAGVNRPIMQWIPLIKKIQAHRPVIVDLSAAELEAFMAEMKPEGLFLWIGSENKDEQQAILKRLKQWK